MPRSGAFTKGRLRIAEFVLAPGAASVGFGPGFVLGKPLGTSPGAASKCAIIPAINIVPRAPDSASYLSRDHFNEQVSVPS